MPKSIFFEKLKKKAFSQKLFLDIKVLFPNIIPNRPIKYLVIKIVIWLLKSQFEFKNRVFLKMHLFTYN
jgi:hypothetical protein